MDEVRQRLSLWVEEQAIAATKRVGYDYMATKVAPSNLGELLTEDQYCRLTGVDFRVWSGGSSKTIYTAPSYNWAFRFWHDVLHIEHRKDVTLQDELYVAGLHIAAASERFGSNSVESFLIEADTLGQTLYQHRYGEFPEDQLGFARKYLEGYRP